jgi:succinyl-CoA synthetase alpha subunit
MTIKPINVDEGLLYFFIKQQRPELAERIKETKKIETMIIGLGRQGTNHAKRMQDYGTIMTCGVAPGRGGSFVHETIPVYNTVKEALKEHPDIAVTSIWRHYSTAKDATIEAIEAGIPLIVLISEFIPLKDVRDILKAARKHNTILFGGNTPGIIFPPERIKIGMLPNVFHPEDVEQNTAGPSGVTIISRSGAILYHISDALASVGIAQNGVLGIGGDGAIGSRFVDLVSKVMQYDKTDAVVIAGEIGGMQEELLAQDIKNNPKKYPKPLVALISGAQAPSGKTMGHAGAVVAPGQEYGTFKSKKSALEDAGVTVVNNQWDLIEQVNKKVQKQYFDPEMYYKRMKEMWDAKAPIPTWGTLITKVVPNSLIIRGYLLQELIEKKTLIEISYLMLHGEFPDPDEICKLTHIVKSGIRDNFNLLETIKHDPNEDISKTIGNLLLVDELLPSFLNKTSKLHHKLAYTFGRALKIISNLLSTSEEVHRNLESSSLSELLYFVITGKELDTKKARLIESMVSACVDHGVTPPSAQTTLLLASARASFEVSLAGGIHAITDVHGGAGTKACIFYLDVVKKSNQTEKSLESTAFDTILEIVKSGERIEGLGHRIHTQDPRREILLDLAKKAGVNGSCIKLAIQLPYIFYQVKGMNLPVNVDGVIGAIVGDLGLDPVTAKVIFILGRIIGLTAHYFEEIRTQQPMRRINFDNAVYKGEKLRNLN